MLKGITLTSADNVNGRRPGCTLGFAVSVRVGITYKWRLAARDEIISAEIR